MPRVAKPKAAKAKAPKKSDEALPEGVSAGTSVATELRETPESAAPPSGDESAEMRSTDAPEASRVNGDNDTDMVLRPPTGPVETAEQIGRASCRERV